MLVKLTRATAVLLSKQPLHIAFGYETGDCGPLSNLSVSIRGLVFAAPHKGGNASGPAPSLEMLDVSCDAIRDRPSGWKVQNASFDYVGEAAPPDDEPQSSGNERQAPNLVVYEMTLPGSRNHCCYASRRKATQRTATCFRL